MNRIQQSIVGIALLLVTQAASAERVFVKSRGEVDLGPFRCAGFSRSENVKRVCYDEREAYVLVSLKGIWYHFCHVPPAAVSVWRRSSAPGRYYNDHVRQKFECQESEAPTYR